MWGLPRIQLGICLEFGGSLRVSKIEQYFWLSVSTNYLTSISCGCSRNPDNRAQISKAAGCNE